MHKLIFKSLLTSLALFTFVSGHAQVGINTVTPTSTLDVNGSITTTIETLSTNTTLNEAHHTVIADGITIMLPDPTNIIGREYIIKAGISGNTTITPNAADIIDLSPLSIVLKAYESVKIKAVSAGNWTIINRNGGIVEKIDDLSDAKVVNFGVYLGAGAGAGAAGARNTAVGEGALLNGGGDDNVAIGYLAGDVLTSGSKNTFLGHSAGANSGTGITTGDSNILIGYDVQASDQAVDQELNIGDAMYATGLYSSTPKVGIGNGNNAPNSALSVNGSMSTTIETLSTSTTLSETHHTVIADGITVTLPDPTNIIGREYIIKAGISGNTTITPNAADIIDLSPLSIVLKAYESIKIKAVSAGNWTIINSNGGIVEKIDDLSDAKFDTTKKSLYIGQAAGLGASGSENTAVGEGALLNTNGNNNIALGYLAGDELLTGNNNIFLGHSAGAGSVSGLEAGTSNILIGYNVQTSNTTAAEELNLGDAVYAKGLYSSTAKVGIGNGNNAPNSTLSVNGSVATSTVAMLSATTLDDTHHTIFAGADITLPPAIDVIGREYIIKAGDANTVTITPNGSDKIDEFNSYVLNILESVTLKSVGGGEWLIVGGTTKVSTQEKIVLINESFETKDNWDLGLDGVNSDKTVFIIRKGSGGNDLKINGIAGGTEGRRIRIINDSNKKIKFDKEDDGNAAAGNKYYRWTDIDEMDKYGACELIYSTAISDDGGHWNIVQMVEYVENP